MAFIKVCGITEEEQAKKIASLGASYIGVVYFPESPRHINLDEIKKIKNSLPENVKLVAVVVNPKKEDVEKLLEVADLIQFHGDESLEFVKQFPKEKVIKAFRLKDEKSLKQIKPFVDEGYLILIDAYSEKEYGGTGKRINKNLVGGVKNITDKFILSGGLSDENVYDLIKLYKPYGVDASSKLEIKAGIKDLNKVKNYIQNAQKAFEEINIE